MKIERWILRFVFMVSMITATIMAFFKFGYSFEESFSQNDLDIGDPYLRAYLGGISSGFLLFAGWAKNRKEKFTFIKWKIQWMALYLFIGFCFWIISVTNVSQIYIPHMVVTALGSLGAYVMAWNYFKTPWKRSVSIISATLGASYFTSSVLFGVDTIARGEWAITLPIFIVALIMINELIREK